MSKHGGKDIREKHRHVNRYADKSQADRAIGSTQTSGPVDVDALLYSIREADMKSRRKQAASFGPGHSHSPANRRPQPDPLVSASYLQSPASTVQSSQPTEPTITSPKTTPTDPRVEGPRGVKPSATPKTYAQQIRKEIKELVEQLSHDSDRLDALNDLRNHIKSGSYDTRQIVLEMMREIIERAETQQFSDEIGRGYLVLHLTELYCTLAHRNLLSEPVDIEAMLRLRTLQFPADATTSYHIRLNLNIVEGVCARHQTVGPILAELKRQKLTGSINQAPILERGFRGEQTGKKSAAIDAIPAREPLADSHSASAGMISDPSNDSELKIRIDGLIEQLGGPDASMITMEAVNTLRDMIKTSDKKTTDAIRVAFRVKIAQLGIKDRLTREENAIARGMAGLYFDLADLGVLKSDDVVALGCLQRLNGSDAWLLGQLVNAVMDKLSERVLTIKF